MAAEPIPAYEYLGTPEVLTPQELVWGYVREAAAPTAAHQRTVGSLFIHRRNTFLVAQILGVKVAEPDAIETVGILQQ